MVKLWNCPSREIMREMVASKKSFKMLPYGSYLQWLTPTRPSYGEKVVDIWSTKRRKTVTLVYTRGEESIHNTLINHKDYFWGKSK